MLSRVGRWVVLVGVVMLACLATGSSAFAAERPARAVEHPAGPASPAGHPLAPGAEGTPGEVLKVGIKPLDPFVSRDGSAYRGFSIDLWNEIARRNDWHTRYVWHDTLPALLTAVQNGQVDVGISGITITKEREEVLDFTYPMFSAGLEVMTSPTASPGWAGELAEIFTAGIGRYLLVLIAALVLAGHVIWLATRRHTGRGYLAGVGHGVYQAAGLGLVGDYGVADPKRPLARAAAVLWSIAGISFVSLFTAALASQLTVHSIQNKITGVHDLTGANVVTVAGTSSEAYLRTHAIAYTAVPTIDDAYRRLDSGTADAVVYDAPVLQNRVKETGTTREILVGGIFARENYGIAVPTGSDLRKKINTTLLDMVADGTYDDLYSRYFTETGSG